MPELCKRCNKPFEPSPGSFLKICPACDDERARHYGSASRASLQVLDGLIELLAIFLIAFTPIAFGATERWSKLIAETTVFTMCGLWLFKGILRHKLAFVKSPLNLLVAGFIVVACLQLVPLPKVLSSRLAPAAVAERTGTLPGANRSAEAAIGTPEEPAAPVVAAGRQTPPRCISVNRAASRSMLFLIVSYAIAFIVTINVIRRRSQIARLVTAMVVVGFIVAMIGILGEAAPNGKIMWFRDPPSGAISFGPFVNRNHFAGYMVMSVLVALGMLVGTRNREKRILLGFASAMMMASVLVSASRGGAFSLVVGGIVFGLLMLSARSARRNVAPVAVVCGLALVAAVALGIQPLLSRAAGIAAPAGEEYRLGVWKDATRIIAGFPILGVGLGGFRSIFPMYKTLPVQLTFTHVENDYLQLVVEMGIVGFTIGMAFIAVIVRYVMKSLTLKRSTYTRGIIIGLSAAAAAMLVHSMFDFNLHVPSNGLLFALILGLLAVLSSLHVSRSPSKVSWIGQPAGRILKGETVAAPGMLGAFAASMACLCMLAYCAAGRANSFLAQRELDSVEQQAIRLVKGEGSLNVVDGIQRVQTALKRDSENGEWRFRAGIFYQSLAQIKERSGEAVNRTGSHYLYNLAINEFRRACQLDRFNGHYQASLAIALAESGDVQAADRAFRMALKLDPTSAFASRRYGEMIWDANRQTAQRAFRLSLGLDPHHTKAALTRLRQKTNEISELGSCVPDSSEARFEYASFLSNNHLPDESERVLMALLPALESNPSMQPLAARAFFGLGQIRQERGAEQDAMAYFLKAVSLEPGECAYYEELGYACLRQKRYAEAKRFMEQRLRMGASTDGNVFLALAEIYENVGPVDTANKYYRRALEAFPEGWAVSRNKALQGIQRTTDQ